MQVGREVLAGDGAAGPVPGHLGQVDAVLARDYPTVQAVVLLFSLVYVGVNLMVDLAYVWLDPRIRY